ncbi:MAG TPA: prolyl oligopeptidase family serine peptidase [Candidatus Sulfotelmatobacter sp.]|nr:prolyl oligopeptidase family serine peptidase [Candidatus Sulfotelmatobacter sp.]
MRTAWLSLLFVVTALMPAQAQGSGQAQASPAAHGDEVQQGQPGSQKQGPPVARRDNLQETLHGVTISDPYRWLEDQNSLDTRAWINAENAYTHAQLDSWPGRSALEKRISELKKVESIHSPLERSGRLFYLRRAADQEQYIIYMRQGQSGKEEVLIDPNPMSPDHSTNVNIADVSKDGKILAYMVREGGKDETQIRFMDVDTRHDLTDKLPAALYFDLSFLPDDSGFYYSLMIDDGPRVRFHKMSADVATDPDVFGKGYAKEAIVTGDPSEDGRHLIVTVFHGAAADNTEIWTKDLVKDGPIEPLVNDVHARFFAYPAGDRLFVQTNWNAPRGRILAVDFAHPARDQWKEVVPEGDNAIDNVSLAGGKLLVTYINNASSQVKIIDAEGKLVRELKLPALGTVTDIQSKWENKSAYFSYESFAIPPTVYRFDTAIGEQSKWYQTKVPIDSSKLDVEQVWFHSKDGTRVPMFLVHGRAMKRDGASPTVLEGYGGFLVNITPTFSPNAIILAEHGGVYAMANLRGGGEFGEAWHKAGMLANKQNVFDDFIAASEWLIANKYTNPSKLAIVGGSNGGLLVGASLTQRPDLYQAVVCWHPLLDMLRYDKFMEAQFWVSEYGSASDQEQFKWLYAYSPYQHVKAGTKYPAVLFMTGDGDTRVAPLHARKMAALLQASTASDRPILLRYELKAGHSGGRSVTQDIGDTTDSLSFLFWQLGVGM